MKETPVQREARIKADEAAVQVAAKAQAISRLPAETEAQRIDRELCIIERRLARVVRIAEEDSDDGHG